MFNIGKRTKSGPHPAVVNFDEKLTEADRAANAQLDELDKKLDDALTNLRSTAPPPPEEH